MYAEKLFSNDFKHSEQKSVESTFREQAWPTLDIPMSREVYL